jgi:AcrR family transcriptional regulator
MLKTKLRMGFSPISNWIPLDAGPSDHTPTELDVLFVDEGRRQLATTGLARFTAREVAKQVGYSIGTHYNVFGSYDGLMLAINARTLTLWAADLRARLALERRDRIAALVRGYLAFAIQNLEPGSPSMNTT